MTQLRVIVDSCGTQFWSKHFTLNQCDGPKVVDVHDNPVHLEGQTLYRSFHLHAAVEDEDIQTSVTLQDLRDDLRNTLHITEVQLHQFGWKRLSSKVTKSPHIYNHSLNKYCWMFQTMFVHIVNGNSQELDLIHSSAAQKESPTFPSYFHKGSVWLHQYGRVLHTLKWTQCKKHSSTNKYAVHLHTYIIYLAHLF